MCCEQDRKLIEKALGIAEVREQFKIPKIGVIAGCYIREGKVIAYPTEGVWALGGLNTPEIIKAIDLIKKIQNYSLFFCHHMFVM